MEDELKRRILTASGKKKADLVIKNAKIVDVFSHSIIEGSFAVDNGRIAGIGPYEGVREIDVQGNYVIPGLIDSHVHIESSHVMPGQYAGAVIPHGTTAVIADPHEIANVLGAEGIKLMIEASKGVPLHIFFMIPSCVPATSFENAGARLSAEDIDRLMDEDMVLGLGEVMDFPSLLAADPSMLAKLRTAGKRHKPIDGHGPMLSGRDLNAYAAAGVGTDHECSTVDEMNERLKNGMYVLLREGSAARNLEVLLGGVTPYNSRRCAFCTDDRQPEDLLEKGHIDNHLRIAVQRGIDPVTAVQMATINSAECYQLESIGAIAPGYFADFAVVEDLKDFRVVSTYFRGVKVAENGEALFKTLPPPSPQKGKSVHVGTFPLEGLKLPLTSDIARVMRLQSMSLFTEMVQRKVYRDGDGFFQYHPDLDICKLAVIERHHATGNIGLGLVENYKIRNGAIASTIAHDSHNIIVIGDNDEDMYRAAEELIRVGGGISLCSRGSILRTLELPIGGLMSDRPLEVVYTSLREMHTTAFDVLHVNRELDPFMTLSFLALPVIPELKLTDMGLFDVTTFGFTSVSV